MTGGGMDRRRAMALLAGSALAAKSFAQKPGGRPVLCAYSGNLAKIPYGELADVVKQMGYDGVDLTVMKGGHVDPAVYNVDLSRAFETIHDAGLDLPMVTTSFTSASQPYAYAVLYVAGLEGARFCRLGTWPAAGLSPAPGNPDQQTRTMMLRSDMAQFAATGARCKITPLLTNHAGSFPGRNIPETDALLSGINTGALGYCFDPAQAVAETRAADGWEAALEAALPRLKAVSLSDAVFDRDGAPPRPCPLGEGAIDWKKFFSVLASARFSGPVSLQMNYETRNEVISMSKDLAWARARVNEVWKT
jgi:sugar phosphate isomerase/epimerase